MVKCLGFCQNLCLRTHLNQSPSLHIGPGLVGDLHDKLLVLLDDHVEDVEVHRGPEVVNVGDEAVLLARPDKLVKQTTVGEGLVEVPVARRVPGLNVELQNKVHKDFQSRAVQ